MELKQAQELLKAHGQEQLLQYYDELDDEERAELLEDISRIDFSIVEGKRCRHEAVHGTIRPIDAVSVEDIAARREEFETVGIQALNEGKVAAVVLAGGQGSRLGFSKPKGMYNMGLTHTMTIFELQMRNIIAVAEKAKPFHIFIMTSRQNNEDTKNFFKDNGYFGYPEDKIHFYIQNVSPSCDYNGKIFLDTKCHVALTPNGNGGWYSSLVKNGLGPILKQEGIEWLNVYSVDNVLQRICDPVFIGATLLKGCNCGAKVVRKAFPDEKVGVLCLERGKPAIIEYYELPEGMKVYAEDGQLKYRWGVILNYLFNIDKLNSTIHARLPYHAAEKIISHVENGERITPDKPCGYKFETLVVDMVERMGDCLAYEVERDKEFAPVKNATGVDSVESARALLVKNGIEL